MNLCVAGEDQPEMNGKSTVSDSCVASLLVVDLPDVDTESLWCGSMIRCSFSPVRRVFLLAFSSSTFVIYP